MIIPRLLENGDLRFLEGGDLRLLEWGNDISLTKFKGISDIGLYTMSDQYKVNIKTWLDWAFLEIGGFSNVNATATSPSLSYSPKNTRLSRLTYIADPNYTAGTVWQAFKNDLVWETSLTYAHQPIADAVYLGGVLQTTGFHIDFPLGRVVFSSAKATNSTVDLSFSHRYYNTYIADHLPQFQEIVNTLETTNLLSQSRVHLPCIIIEVISDKQSRGLQLGGGQWVVQDVLFHIYAKNKSDRDKAVDILSFQKHKSFMMFNFNDIFTAGKLPLLGNGSRNPSGIMYPTMIQDYPWKKVFIKDYSSKEVSSKSGVYRSTVRYNLESDFQNLS